PLLRFVEPEVSVQLREELLELGHEIRRQPSVEIVARQAAPSPVISDAAELLDPKRRDRGDPRWLPWNGLPQRVAGRESQSQESRRDPKHFLARSYRAGADYRFPFIGVLSCPPSAVGL